ncbi:MAG: synthase subunit gamma [Rickettsiaceae bacterium]|jgi:F-type H+-transporting ATPase subunit gamma|nr:synthase subunit gamma [Rickettsiaceae bacterium]
MSGLKDLRNRVKSIKSTQKITKAMQMVAAAKLRKVRDAAANASEYSELMSKIVARVAKAAQGSQDAPKLLTGTGKDQTYLLLIMTSDKGLCGAFNFSILRRAKQDIEKLIARNAAINILCIGKKGYEHLKLHYPNLKIEQLNLTIKDKPSYSDAKLVKEYIHSKFVASEFDVCKLYFSKFKNAISQVATSRQLIPAPIEGLQQNNEEEYSEFTFEPKEEILLEHLLNDNLLIQLYSSILENVASEHGARMTAMDNATKNARDMISSLTLQLNRTRQAIITKELIEIISGADAL